MSAASAVSSTTTKTYTVEDVKKHTTKGDAWIIIRSNIYNVSFFKHPGGDHFLSDLYGKDATSRFFQGHQETGKQIELLKKEHLIGKLATPPSGKSKHDNN